MNAEQGLDADQRRTPRSLRPVWWWLIAGSGARRWWWWSLFLYPRFRFTSPGRVPKIYRRSWTVGRANLRCTQRPRAPVDFMVRVLFDSDIIGRKPDRPAVPSHARAHCFLSVPALMDLSGTSWTYICTYDIYKRINGIPIYTHEREKPSYRPTGYPRSPRTATSTTEARPRARNPTRLGRRARTLPRDLGANDRPFGEESNWIVVHKRSNTASATPPVGGGHCGKDDYEIIWKSARVGGENILLPRAQVSAPRVCHTSWNLSTATL